MPNPEPRSPRRPLSGWFASYRSRYALLALGVSLALLLAGLSGRLYLERVTKQQLSLLADWSRRSNALTNASMKLSTLQARLLDFILDPRPTRGSRLIRARKDLQSALLPLVTPPIEEPLAALGRQLEKSRHALASWIPELVDLRTDVHRWLPASALMETRMVPQAKAMAGLFEGLHAQLPPSTPKTREHLALLRYTWLRLISEFRLYMANRFGIFSPPHQGMEAHAHNIETFAQAFAEDLRQLREVLAQETPDLLEFANLDAMKDRFRAWLAAYRDVRQELDSPRWRRDVYLIRSHIAPALQDLRGTLEAFRQVLDDEALSNRQEMEDTARGLSLFLLVLVGFAIAVVTAGYFLFRHWLLRPIAETTRAMRQIAHGQPVRLEHQGHIEETHDLLDAFDELRYQVSERERRLQHLANHDRLTRLPNRTLFEDRLFHALQRLERERQGFIGLVFLDLDGFKEINDHLGHQAGDVLLYEVAERLRGCVRGNDTLARLSGDEFALLLEDLPTRERAARVADKILDLLQAPFVLPAGGAQRVGASLGIAIAPLDGTDPRQLLRYADAAMYQAKRAGRNRYCFFSAELRRETEAHRALADALEEALAQDRLELRLQPVESLLDGRRVGYRTGLFRTLPDGGAEPVEPWLPQIESPDLLTRLGKFLLSRLPELTSAVPGEGTPWVCVKPPAACLREPEFLQRLCSHLETGEIDPDRLFLEVEENQLLDPRGRRVHRLLECKARGLHLALGGFGAGGVPLHLLRNLGMEIFVLAPEWMLDNGRVAGAMIQLAHALGGRLAVFGVREEERLGWARQRCADLAAGEAVGPWQRYQGGQGDVHPPAAT